MRYEQPRKPLAFFLLIGIAALSLVLAACSSGGQPTPAEPPEPPAPAAKPVPPPAPSAPPPAPAPTEAEPSVPEAQASFEPVLPETLFLEILEPVDESVVYDSTLVVVGRTTPDAVVSVNEQTAEVNAQGDFVALVTLESGPNVIEVAASDLAGSQDSALLAVIYIP